MACRLKRFLFANLKCIHCCRSPLLRVLSDDSVVVESVMRWSKGEKTSFDDEVAACCALQQHEGLLSPSLSWYSMVSFDANDES